MLDLDVAAFLLYSLLVVHHTCLPSILCCCCFLNCFVTCKVCISLVGISCRLVYWISIAHEVLNIHCGRTDKVFCIFITNLTQFYPKFPISIFQFSLISMLTALFFSVSLSLSPISSSLLSRHFIVLPAVCKLRYLGFLT